MISLLATLESFVVILLLPAWLYSRRRNMWFLWDYAAMILPFVLWIVLCDLGIGPQSLSNLVELVIVGGCVVGASYIRIFCMGYFINKPLVTSQLMFVIVMIVPIALRLTMPLLAE